MTNEQAIKSIQELKYCFRTCLPRDKAKALDMAVEALEDMRPKGHWIVKHIETVPNYLEEWFYCSECGEGQLYGMPHFCPHCGADMRGEICGCDIDYEQAVTQLVYDIQYEPTYNPEDGSA